MLVLLLLADCAKRLYVLVTCHRGTLSFSPMIRYELCARWLEHKENHKYDLSAWRVADVDAEVIRKETTTEGFWNFEAYKNR